MMGQRQTTDRIGSEAQQQFRSWSNREDFRASEDNPDQLGVDYRVELTPLPGSGPQPPLDEAAPAIFLSVQVRGTQGTPSNAQDKLDNWKRHIENVEPRFYLLVRFDAAYETIGATLLHVDRRVVEHVKQRMREAAATSINDMHGIDLCVPWSWGVALEAPYPQSFVREVRRIVGDPDAYAEQKRDWCRSVGYEANAAKIEAKGSPSDIAAVLVGERRELQVVSNTNTRFDVEVPGPIGSGRHRLTYTKPTSAQIRVVAGAEEVTIRGNVQGAGLEHRFPTDTLMPKDKLWKFRGSGVEIFYFKSGQLSVHAEMEGDELGRTAEFLRLLQTHGSTLSMRW